VRHGCTDRANCYPGAKRSGWMTVPGPMPSGASADHGAAAVASSRKPVDEESGGAGGVCQVSFEDGHIEGQIIAFEFRSLNHDRVLGRAVRAQDRDGSVGRILGKAVIAYVPLLDEVRREDMACRANRTISENNRV
jgi:hypothetical protein